MIIFDVLNAIKQENQLIKTFNKQEMNLNVVNRASDSHCVTLIGQWFEIVHFRVFFCDNILIILISHIF